MKLLTAALATTFLLVASPSFAQVDQAQNQTASTTKADQAQDQTASTTAADQAQNETAQAK